MLKYLLLAALLTSCSLPPPIVKHTPRERKINVMDRVIKCADKFINMGVDAEIAFKECKSIYGVNR